MKQQCLFTLATLLALSNAHAEVTHNVKGQEVVFSESNDERCVILNKIPAFGNMSQEDVEKLYSKKDLEKEKAYCEFDFYSSDFALCPKTWSTSPGIVIYDLTKRDENGPPLAPSKFESERCSHGKTAHRGEPNDSVKLAKKFLKYKTSMNDQDTSGTYSRSSLLYYHLSRYFDTTVEVPVAVYRSLNSKIYLDRVASKAVPQGRMNRAGWERLKTALTTGSYPNPSELFADTTDLSQVFGVLLKDKGQRYNKVFNGTREGGEAGQNKHYQETAPYLALRSNRGDLREDIANALDQVSRDSGLSDVSTNITVPQMVFWMKEATEIGLLDFILSQQDRVGNIDFEWKWYYIDTNSNDETVVKNQDAKDSNNDDWEVQRPKGINLSPPPEIADKNPILIQRTNIGDNDAGARVPYANDSKKYGFLDRLTHFGAKTYKRLIMLDKDLQNQGQLYTYLSTTFGIDTRQFQQIVTNTRLAAEKLKEQCNKKTMKFDLEPKKSVLGEFSVENLDCDNPL